MSRINQLGRKASVYIANRIGTIGFIVGQASFLAAWFMWNLFSPWKFDPYPFILANLFMSAEAAFATSLLLMAAEITDAEDRKTANADLVMDAETHAMVTAIAQHLGVTDGAIRQGQLASRPELYD